MITYKRSEFMIINPVDRHYVISDYKDPIWKTRQDWALTLDDMEEQYRKDYKHMKIIKTLRRTVERIFGRKKEEYRKVLPTVLYNLDDMEWDP